MPDNEKFGDHKRNLPSRSFSRGFSVDPNLLVELSRKLVSRDDIALLELVKNSWDADATCVDIAIDKHQISVKDNGTGMDEGSIENGWMRLGTSLKAKERKTKSGRKVLGSKGLGRLAVFRLGRRATIETRKEGSPFIKVSMELPPKSTLADQQSRLDDYKYDFFVDTGKTMEFPCGGDNGTIITVVDLYKPPSDNFVDNIRDTLSKMGSSQNDENGKFDVSLVAFGNRVKLSQSDELPDWDYWVDSTFGVPVRDEKDQVVFTLQMEMRYRLMPGGPVKEENFTRNLKDWKLPEEGGVGKFKMSLKVWDLDRHAGSRRDIKSSSGISVVRNGFTTVSPKVDWLGLNMRRVNQPTMRLSTNQISGTVFIDSDENPNLEDKTDREGLLENEALELLKEYVIETLDILERRRRRARNQSNPGHGSPLQQLDTAELRAIAKVASGDISKLITKQADRFDDAREKLEDILLGRDRMASLGLLAARVVHETKNAISIINGGNSALERQIEELGEANKDIAETAKRMVKAGKEIYSVVNSLTNLIRFKGGPISSVKLEDVVSTLVSLYSAELRHTQTAIIRNYDPSFEQRIRPPDLYVMLANLLDNSVYWIRESGKMGGRITISAVKEPGGTTLAVDDSGPGIPAEISENIFEPGFTTKPGGTGLGLATIRDIAMNYHGLVSYAEVSENGGARFEIFIPSNS